jgi:hypothetical protein
MNKVHNRLKNSKGGPQTQKIQREITDRLKAIIDKIEDDRKKALDSVNEARSTQQTTPPPDTPYGQESGTGSVDKKKIKEIAEVWGRLAPKERATAMQHLLRNLPAKDKSVVEAYFRELSKKSK